MTELLGLQAELLDSPASPLMIKEALRDALAAADPTTGETYEEWQQLACRSGLVDGVAVDSLVRQVLQNMIRQACEEAIGGSATPAQQETLRRMLGAREEFRRVRKSNEVFDPSEVLIVLGLAGGTRGLATTFYLSAWSDAQYAAKSTPVFADLSQAHYPGLATPESLLKYEALTQEEVDRRRAEERAARETEEP